MIMLVGGLNKKETEQKDALYIGRGLNKKITYSSTVIGIQFRGN